MKLLRAFARFWWDFVIGEDWRVAAGVISVLALGAILAGATDVSDTVLTLLLGCLLLAGVALSIVLPALRARRRR